MQNPVTRNAIVHAVHAHEARRVRYPQTSETERRVHIGSNLLRVPDRVPMVSIACAQLFVQDCLSLFQFVVKGSYF